jgi:hypothetical protein
VSLLKLRLFWLSGVISVVHTLGLSLGGTLCMLAADHGEGFFVAETDNTLYRDLLMILSAGAIGAYWGTRRLSSRWQFWPLQTNLVEAQSYRQSAEGRAYLRRPDRAKQRARIIAAQRLTLANIASLFVAYTAFGSLWGHGSNCTGATRLVVGPSQWITILAVLLLFLLWFFPTKKRVYGAIEGRLPKATVLA